MDRLTDLCLRHRRWVVGAWVLLALVGAVCAAGLSNRLDTTFSLPGQAAYETDQAVIHAYGTGGGNPPAVVTVTVATGTVATPAVRTALDHAFAAAADAAGTTGPFRSVYPGTAGAPGAVDDPRLVSADGRTALGLVLMPPQSFTATDPSDAVRAAVTRSLRGDLPGATVGVTGLSALQSDSDSGGGSGVLVETLLAGLGALLVLAFVFGSFVAVLPLLMAAVSILTTFAVIDLLTTFTSVSFIVQFLIGLIGLGVAIDYALLVVTRWREERLAGRGNEEAVRVAMQTAGHAVVFSGVTVAVGLFSLVFLPVPFLRSVGYAGMLIPLISVLVATTLLPVMLRSIGPFLDRPARRRALTASRPWSGWARLVVRRRWLAAALALVVLGGLGYEASHIAVGEPRSSTLSKAGPAFDGLQQLQRAGFSTGVITPIEVLDAQGDGSAIVAATRAVPGVLTAVVSGSRPGATTVEVLPLQETSQPPGSHLVGRVRTAVSGIAGARVGGDGAEDQAFSHAVYGSFPLMFAVILVLTFLLLARAFRSVVLPLKAVLLNVISVGSTYGVLVLVWQLGHGSSLIWNIDATGAITSWVPLMVFAFLFGLSMDYEVFILARMREEYDAGRTTDAAVVEGIGRTGRLVTSAALILFLAFLALSQTPDTDVKILATGLGAGILLDATVVRALLVPALVSLLGRWNWAMPAWLAKPLRISPSPLRPAAER